MLVTVPSFLKITLLNYGCEYPRMTDVTQPLSQTCHVYDALKGALSPNQKQHYHVPVLHREEMPPLQPTGWGL